MNADEVICSGVKECRNLPAGTEHVIMVGDHEVHVRPENCSGRYPHRPMPEEDDGHVCEFIKKWVEAKRIYQKVFEYD